MIEGKLAILVGFLRSNFLARLQDRDLRICDAVTTWKENDSTNGVNGVEGWQPYASGRGGSGRRQRRKKRNE
jgi:hypothetical protein